MILLNRLQTSLDISGTALAWFRFYLSSRNQFVRFQPARSAITNCTIGVPQWSMLGPVIFFILISPIAQMVTFYGLEQWQYAEDIQLYVAISRLNPDTVLSRPEECLSVLKCWFCHIGLALHPSRTKIGTRGCRYSALSI